MLRVSRQFDAERLNAVVNHPEIYPWVHGIADGPLDFGGWFADDSPHVNLMGEYGGCVFMQHQTGIYEVHTHILPEGRGAWAIEAVRECLHYIFTSTEAVEIWTRVPKGNTAARALVRLMGGTLQFRSSRGWVIDGQEVYADIFSMTLQDWMLKNDSLSKWGEWFQNQLDDEYRRLGEEGVVRETDPNHNKYIGAAVEMIKNGQPHKGVIFYNRWARMASFMPMQLLSLSPVAVNIGGAIVELHGSNFFVSTLNSSYSH